MSFRQKEPPKVSDSRLPSCESLTVAKVTERDEKMKIAYLILVHDNPVLLKRMIEFLSSDDAAFFIHVDKKSDMGAFTEVKGKNIFFSPERIPVYWGEYSMVEATLILIQQAVHAYPKNDYCVSLSGNTYPLKSREYIHDFFDKNRGHEFINMINIYDGSGSRASSACSRYISRKYCSYLKTLRVRSDRPISRYGSKVLARLGLARRDYRKYLETLEPYAGSMWWALTMNACRYILDFVKTNQSFCRYYEDTFVPDEMFFHTILGNSMFRPRIRRSLMYVDWSVPARHSHGDQFYGFLERSSNMSGHPAMLNETHINFFEQNERIMADDIYGPGEMLFARKFSDARLDLVRRIEKKIGLMDKDSSCHMNL